MPDSIQIRRARLDDATGMLALLKELFSLEADFSFDAAKQERGLKLFLEDERNRCALVATDSDGRILGMVTMQLVVSTAEGALSGWLEVPTVRR